MASNEVKILLAPRANLLGSLALLLVLLPLYVTIAQVKPLVQITPGIYKMRLGTRITDVAKTYPMKDTQDPKISLYHKFGFGDPDKEEIVNKRLGRQFYEISERRPPDVMSIRLITAHGIVYEVAVYYEQEYTKRMSWEIFTYHAIKNTANQQLLTDF